MAHESFEDEATAALMNELFVNIKVDREERPDIDAIYMHALHSLGEHGGWPLTMFLDREARPFWGGTYFPPEPRFGRPSFKHVLAEVARIYADEPDKISHNAALLVQSLAEREKSDARANIKDAALADLTRRMVNAVDMRRGGLAGAPKFPQWSFFWLLWRGAIRHGDLAAREAVDVTLANICQGGIYDHLGGGFARYSVDERWLAPHFEKMLYDNALLVDLLCEAYREGGNELYQVRIAETVDWLRREMIAEGGGFAASLDADSEGEEGKFYVWSKAEIADVLGPVDAALFCQAYDVTDEGNWEGHAILNRLANLELGSPQEEQALAAMRAKLLARRAQRIRPGWDDKVLADWNGLMIAALAHAAQVFARPDWLDTAKAAFAFVTSRMEKDGRLIHSYRAGQAKVPATASDYANMIWGALRLHQATNAAPYLASRGALGGRSRSALLDRRHGRLCLHRRRHARRHRAHAHRPRRRHPQRQCADDLQPRRASPAHGQAGLPRSRARHPRRLRARPRPQRARPLRRARRLLRSAGPSARCRHRAGLGGPLPAPAARHVRAVFAGCGAAGRGVGSAPRRPGAGRQDRDRGQAHRLRLHRPAVLAARSPTLVRCSNCCASSAPPRGLKEHLSTPKPVPGAQRCG